MEQKKKKKTQGQAITAYINFKHMDILWEYLWKEQAFKCSIDHIISHE